MTETAPLTELTDEVLLGELGHLYETRIDTLRHGSDDALENHTERMQELEREYLRRHPQREVDPDRLRPHHR
jgi:hypothetical protein